MKKESLSITLERSGIGRPKAQQEILKGLGLRKLHKTVVRPDSPEIRGMVKKVVHLVTVQKGK
ncbi:MAG TPA: 50S ribosomal protein L30 [Nitrospiria bacterium]|jgi:large subunit ribosomal protein L30